MRKGVLSTLRYVGISLVLILGLAAIIGTGDSSSGSGLHRTTEFGSVKGYIDDSAGVRAWRGIPFAKPPVGDLRWQPPQDPEPWSETLEADQSGSPCVQFEMDRTWHPTGEIIGSEDCLYLDIYRPDSNDADLPVYFWIHGGSNRFGGAATYEANAKAMARKLNIVVVVTQYRLGPFGWFRHADLRSQDLQNSGNSGNFGTLDQIQALEWVQQNIAEFGGDPANVTIAGQSAGGHNVMNLVISPQAEGLFHQAVSESGIMPVIDANDSTAETVAANLGLEGDDLAGQLRSADAQAILAASSSIRSFSAFADGYVLPDTVVNAIYQGNYNQVPIMLGVNHEEFYNFLPLYGEALGKPSWEKVHDLFNPDSDPDHEWTYEEIFPPGTDEEAIYQTTGRYASMGYRAKYLDELASHLAEQQGSVYGYVFEWAGGGVDEMETFQKVFGAAHSMEIPFFFGGDHSLFGYSFIEANETGRKALQEVMQTYLYNFMTTGDPGTAEDGTPWDAWSNEEGMYKAITFDADANEAKPDYIEEKLTFDDVDDFLEAQLSTMNRVNAATWGHILPTNFSQEAEALRFSHKLDFEAGQGATAYSGTYGYDVDEWSGYDLAGYRLEIPEGWDPATDGLVLYCHGYRGDGYELSVSNPEPLREYLIGRGYAWAASSYGENGYNIATGVVGTRRLLDLISAEFGEPDPVYIIGHSMGGHITARSITEYPDAYDGAMPMCGVLGGGVEQFSYSLDWALLGNYFAGLNYDLPFAPAEAQALVGAVFGEPQALGYIPYIENPKDSAYKPEDLVTSLNEAGQRFKDATMYRSGGERPLYDVAFANQALFQMASQGINFAMDPTGGESHGIVADNSEQVYHLNGNPGLSEAETALNEEIARISQDDDDIDFDFENLMYPVYGDISIPVLSLHDIGDWFVPFEHERIYAEKVADAENSDLLRTRIYRSIDHCGFTPEETVAAFEDLAAWVEGGIVPEGDDILDPLQVAADDFGCEFSLQQRPVDLYTDGAGDWICD